MVDSRFLGVSKKRGKSNEVGNSKGAGQKSDKGQGKIFRGERGRVREKQAALTRG